MNSPEPPQLDPFQVVRGAVAEAVLQSGGLPEVPFDRRNPDAYLPAVELHLQTELRPRVERWIRDCMPDETFRTMHGLVGRYNELLARHAGERMTNSDFYPGRPPMDPFDAMQHVIHMDDDVRRAATLGEYGRVAELGGPAASLDAVRAVYIRMLTDTRIGLSQICMPTAKDWGTEHNLHWQRIGHTQLQLLPFAYRHMEEFVARHMVQGPVTDLPTHSIHDRPPVPESSSTLLRDSFLERDRFVGQIAAMRRRAERVLEEYREHIATDAKRTGLGRVIMSYACPFPVDDCRTLARMLRQEQCLDAAETRVRAIHEGWRQALQLQAQPHAEQVRQSYMAVYSQLRPFSDLLERLCETIFDGYEGK